MIKIEYVLIILFIHFVADFICQDQEWAVNKSKSWDALLTHTVFYSAIWLWIGLGLTFSHKVDPLKIAFFTLITFLAHTITDYFTSRIAAKKFANKHLGSKIPNLGAFTVIGFDQVLHFVQLFYTYKLLWDF